jgi:hypothetical protein
VVELRLQRLDLGVRVRLGLLDAGRALAGSDPEERNRAGTRIAFAALALEQDEPERAAESLSPVIDGSAPALYSSSPSPKA